MGVESISANDVTHFSDLVHVAAQQETARSRSYVQMKQIKGADFAYDGLGDVEAREVFGRSQPAGSDDILHNRRKLSRRRFIVNLFIDSADVRSVLLDPSSEYPKACVRAMERQFDRVVVEAALADVQTGRDFGTTLTAAQDGVVVVDATAGLTYEKLLEINQNFMDNEVGNDATEQIVLPVTGKEMTKLMQESELISGDFTRQFAIEKGRLVTAAGIDLIRYGASAKNPILPVVGGVRQSFAMSKGAICVGISQDMTITIEKRKDLIETTQVQVIMDFGAVRTEGKLIQQVNTTA